MRSVELEIKCVRHWSEEEAGGESRGSLRGEREGEWPDRVEQCALWNEKRKTINKI
jgi:hypothetical protein